MRLKTRPKGLKSPASEASDARRSLPGPAVGHLALDERGTICEISPTAAAILGRPRARLLRQRLVDLLAPEEAAKLRQHLQRCFENVRAVVGAFHLAKPSAPGDPIQLYTLPLLERKIRSRLRQSVLLESTPSEGPPRGSRLRPREVGLDSSTRASDLAPAQHVEQTETAARQRLIAALRRCEQRFAEFFETAPVGLVWVGPDGRVLRANQAEINLLGCADADCAGRPLTDFHADPEVVQDLMQRLSQHGTVSDFRARIIRPDGEIRHVLIAGKTELAHGRFHQAILFVRDITRRVELETEILHISEREQQRLGKDLHDSLGQHLHGVVFLAGKLQKILATDAHPAASNAGRIVHLLDEAVTLTRGLAHGLHPVRPEPEGLMTALRELAVRVRFLYRVNCRVHCPKPVLIPENTTATHLYRIAQEAVNNAVKHGQATRIIVGLTATSERINLGIKDNGIGMKSLPPESEGLGIQIMKYRAHAANGSLVIQRRLPGGTEVVCSIRWPRAQPIAKVT